MLGKSYFNLQIEAFLHFFKIDKNIDATLRSVAYFHSTRFIDAMHTILNFAQFGLKEDKGEKKSFFYAFCYHYAKTDPDGFENFAQKTLLHYHTGFNTESNIQIDHQDIYHTLAKTRKITLKESFGEEGEKAAYFKIFIDGTIAIEERGKRIKTLRKKAYKRLLYTLLEMEETREGEDVYEAYEVLEEVGRVGAGALAPSDSTV